MKRLWIPLAAVFAACGGTSNVSPSGTTAQFTQAAPTFSDVAVTQNDADNVEPGAVEGGQDVGAQNLVAAPPDCHPHLFQRTHETMARLNRHFAKVLHHVDKVLAGNPTLADGQQHVWEKVEGGIDRKLTMQRTANADGSVTFAWELDLKGGAATDFVKVSSGTMTLTGGALATTDSDADAGASDAGTTDTVRERKGSATMDFDALAQVATSERARGQITTAFDIVHDPSKPAPGNKRSATITFASFLPEEGDAHGPRNGSYTYEREPGVGGKLSFQDSLILLCGSAQDGQVSELATVARWYKSTDGSIFGRSDAQASGGQIAAGDKWVGVTCAKGQTSAAPGEGYWLMKEESSSGATVAGHADTTGSSPCAAAFGPVPDLSSNANDYDFTKPVTFPNEW